MLRNCHERVFISVDTDEIAESTLMGFLAKLESITCKRTASLFAIIDSPNVSYKRVQGRGGGRIFQRCIGEPFAKKIRRN